MKDGDKATENRTLDSGAVQRAEEQSPTVTLAGLPVFPSYGASDLPIPGFWDKILPPPKIPQCA